MELSDLLPLLDALDSNTVIVETGARVLAVPAGKMDFNELPDASRLEFNAGRLLAPRIDRWYEELSDPGLCDVHG
ncbi:ABC-three component system protein, partial [Klebsiella pneumoniae]|uniref:ABC-three component system protein n=1 Tax=Klebsiella pneumoniae TaxID=573 RepID=UPI00272FB5C2